MPQDVGVRGEHPTRRRVRTLLCDGMDAKHTLHGRRYTVNEAAEHLGISAEAVRARINRGTLPKEKDADGTVYVHLDAVHTHPNGHTNARTNGNDASDHTAGEAPIGERGELVEELRDRVRSLELAVESEREANRENRRIIAALTSRIPQLEAPRDEPHAPETAAEEPERTSPRDWSEGAQETSERRRSWLYRFFFETLVG